jgi:EAL domain-containing protein (putative c-di-GMP-specific phosphodiesterase class I)
MQKILVVDDNPEIGEFISSAAAPMSIVCVVTTDAESFLERLTPDTTLIMLDLVMPGCDGIELLRMLAARKCSTAIVLMSGIGKRIVESAEKLAVSLGLNVIGHLTKPFRLVQLQELFESRVEGRAAVYRPERSKVEIPDEDLERAIEHEEFVLHYQPQLDIPTKDVVGIEALVRWKHPSRGLIYPDDFIPRLEAMGAIDQLGWIVANRGLLEMKQAAGPNWMQPVLSLNVSVYSLYDLNFTDIFVSRLKKHGVEAKQVILEITESGLIKDLSSTLDVLTRLRMKQVNLSIDDFGTGYSMMQQLRLVPATEIKIDKSFVQNMQVNDSDRVMVEKTIEIGHDLGMKVVAEGVETLEQLEFLQSKGCDTAQGYFFSRPLPMDQLALWLAKHHSRVES